MVRFVLRSSSQAFSTRRRLMNPVIVYPLAFLKDRHKADAF